MSRDFYHVCGAIVARMHNGYHELTPAGTRIATTPSPTTLKKFAAVVNDWSWKAKEVKGTTWSRLAEFLATYYPHDEIMRKICNDPTFYKEWLPLIPADWGFLRYGDCASTAEASTTINTLYENLHS